MWTELVVYANAWPINKYISSLTLLSFVASSNLLFYATAGLLHVLNLVGLWIDCALDLPPLPLIGIHTHIHINYVVLSGYGCLIRQGWAEVKWGEGPISASDLTLYLLKHFKIIKITKLNLCSNATCTCKNKQKNKEKETTSNKIWIKVITSWKTIER